LQRIGRREEEEKEEGFFAGVRVLGVCRVRRVMGMESGE
jgi:hypothetical protein